MLSLRPSNNEQHHSNIHSKSARPRTSCVKHPLMILVSCSITSQPYHETLSPLNRVLQNAPQPLTLAAEPSLFDLTTTGAQHSGARLSLSTSAGQGKTTTFRAPKRRNSAQRASPRARRLTRRLGKPSSVRILVFTSKTWSHPATSPESSGLGQSSRLSEESARRASIPV